MEKLRFNYLKLFVLIFIFGVLDNLILKNPAANLDIFLKLMLSCGLLLLIGFISEKYRKSGMYFNSSGITCVRSDLTSSAKWVDIIVDKKINLAYFKLLNLNISVQGKNQRILLFWVSEDSIIDLTKRYVPKNHELYTLVKEYAKKRKIHF